MNDQQIKSVNTRNLLKKITAAIIVVAAYQLTFDDAVERFDSKLTKRTQFGKLELVSGDEGDGRAEITMQFSLNIELGKELNTLIKAIITSR
ncbi:MAG: hypothetical protein ACI89W_001851 [Gammaproteobacteria bacterium]|jgi:hypothetical protein